MAEKTSANGYVPEAANSREHSVAEASTEPKAAAAAPSSLSARAGDAAQ